MCVAEHANAALSPAEWQAAFDDGPSADKLEAVQPYDAGDAKGYDRTYTYDRADRLTNVADRTATVSGPTFDPTDPANTPQAGCAIRSYAFTGTAGSNGSRTASASTNYPGSDCTTNPGATTTRTHAYDTADRPTLGAAINGGPAGPTYVYDELGRRTTLPGVDGPDSTKGNITLAYYDTDLPQAITQAGTTTSHTLNVDGRRQTSTTGPTGGATVSTTTRHYTDTSDNPAWIDKDGAATRYTQSLDGDLGATITADGTATLPLATLHGDNVTNITIPASQTETIPTTTIGAWSDYTEYGTPRDATATNAVAGTAGYGWLGAEERSTTTESADLTLMGDRLYNPATGRFTALDPVSGGNLNAYTYPLDPVGQRDLSGRQMSEPPTQPAYLRHRMWEAVEKKRHGIANKADIKIYKAARKLMVRNEKFVANPETGMKRDNQKRQNYDRKGGRGGGSKGGGSGAGKLGMIGLLWMVVTDPSVMCGFDGSPCGDSSMA